MHSVEQSLLFNQFMSVADLNYDILTDVDDLFMDCDPDVNYFNNIRPVVSQYFTVEQFNLLEDGSTAGLANQNICSVNANFDTLIALLDAFHNFSDIIID